MNANDRKEYLEVSKCALDYKRFQKLKKKKFLKKIEKLLQLTKSYAKQT